MDADLDAESADLMEKKGVSQLVNVSLMILYQTTIVHPILLYLLMTLYQAIGVLQLNSF